MLQDKWPGEIIHDDADTFTHEAAGNTAAPAETQAPAQGAAIDAGFPGQEVAPPAPAQDLPYDPLGQGDIGFSSGDAMVRDTPAGNDEYTHNVTQGILTGQITSVDQLITEAAKYGVPPESWDADRRAQAQTAFDILKKGGKLGAVGGLEYAQPDVEQLRKKDALPEGVDAAARGAVPFGLGDELGAAVDTVRQGGSFSENLHKNRAVRDYDEEHHFWERLGGEIVGSMALPSGVENAAKDAAISGFKTALSEQLARGVPLLEAKVTAKEVAKAAARRAATMRAAGEGAGYGAGYGAGSSDGNAGDRLLAAGVGGVTGGALSAGTTGAATASGHQVAKLLPAAADNEALAAARAAERQNVEILPQDVGGVGVQRATQGTAQTPFGAGPVKRAADRLYDSFRGRVADLGGEVGTTREVGDVLAERAGQQAERNAARAQQGSEAIQEAVGTATDETGAGQIVQRGLNRWMADTQRRATDLYNAVPIAEGVQAVTAPVRQALHNLTTGMESNPVLSAMFQNPRLNGYLRSLTPELEQQSTGLLDAAGRPITREVAQGGSLSWRDLSEFRTRVGDMLDEPRLAEKIAPRQLRALYGALTQSMEQTAQREGPEAIRAWRRANNYYDGRMKRIKDSLSLVLGERTDRTSNEAISSLNAMLKQGSTGNAAGFARIMRSLPPEDAGVVRASLIQAQRGGREFNPDAFAKNWAKISERGKAALLPGRGMREIMDDAAARSAASTRDPLEGKSGEQAFLALERMAANRGDSAQFQARLSAMSPEEASATRSLLIHRLGLAREGGQNAQGDAFSIGTFLSRWNGMTREAKGALFGDAELRQNMNDLAQLAERVKASEKLAGHSNTGAINSLNATTGGLGGAVLALVTGHPIVAAGLAAPAAYQKLSAEVLTSKRFLNWLVKAPKKPNPAAQRAHVLRLSNIAATEPAIANDVFALQQRLLDTFSGSSPARLAADEAGNGALGVPQGNSQNSQDYPGEELPQ